MQRHVRLQLGRDPTAHRANFVVRVVLRRDQQRCDFGPAVGLVDEILQRVEDRGQMRASQPEVELLAERLQVDVGRVHFRVELAARFGMDVARGNCHGLQATRMAGIGGVERVLGEDHRVVVGERDTAAAPFRRGLRDRLGARLVHQAIHFGGLRNIPVLAELAGEVAAGRTE